MWYAIVGKKDTGGQGRATDSMKNKSQVSKRGARGTSSFGPKNARGENAQI